MKKANFCQQQYRQEPNAHPQNFPLYHHRRVVPAHNHWWLTFSNEPVSSRTHSTQAAAPKTQTPRHDELSVNFSQRPGVSHCAPGPKSALSPRDLGMLVPSDFTPIFIRATTHSPGITVITKSHLALHRGTARRGRRFRWFRAQHRVP